MAVKISLNPNSWVFKINRFVYGYRPNEYEQDACKLGWQLIFLPIILLLSWPVLLIMKFGGDRADSLPVISKIILGSIFNLLVIGLGGPITFLLFEELPDLIFIPISLFLGTITLVLFCTIFSAIIYSIHENYSKVKKLFKKERGERTKPKRSFIKEWIKAKKEKTCPIITWEEQK